MIIQKLVLRNFRSYDYADLNFGKGINVIVGENAEGKTNIVEAIHYLSLARSFRTAEDTNLIKEKSDFAAIEAEVSEGNNKKKIGVVLTPSGKKVTCNGKAISRLSELSELVNVVVFEPPRVSLFKESPKARRDFLDISLSKQSSIYLEYVTKFNYALRHLCQGFRVQIEAEFFQVFSDCRFSRLFSKSILPFPPESFRKKVIEIKIVL